MQLILIRHGVAVERDEWDLDDFHRPLTSQGTAKTRDAAGGLAALCVAPEIIATSPKTRALETATAFHEAWDQSPRLQIWPELAESHFETWARLVQTSDVSSLCLVGHEPDLGQFASLLLCGDADSLKVEFKKAGVLAMKLDVTTMRGELLWMLPPRVLRKLRD